MLKCFLERDSQKEFLLFDVPSGWLGHKDPVNCCACHGAVISVYSHRLYLFKPKPCVSSLGAAMYVSCFIHSFDTWARKGVGEGEHPLWRFRLKFSFQ